MTNAIILKNFFLTKEKFRVKSILYSKYFDIKNIDKFKFMSNDSAYNIPKFRVYLKNNKKKTYWFIGNKDEQKLINEIRKLDIPVEVESDIWK